jgi:hypothetical protein
MTDASTSGRDKSADTNDSEIVVHLLKFAFLGGGGGGGGGFGWRQQNYSGDVANFHVALSLTTMIPNEQLVLAV